MHSRRTIARSIIVTLIVAAAAFLISSVVRSDRAPAGTARLIAFERLPEPDASMCEFEEGLDTAVAAFEASQSAPGQGAGSQNERDRAGAARRKPLRMIQDPNAGFNAVAVDPIRNEVVLMDEFHFNAFVYDRLATTPASAPRTKPKRVIGGLKTKSQYGSDVYVDPKSGDIYIINNDSVPGLKIFSRQAQGDVAPDRELETPYGAFGIAVDEEKQELFLTIQHDGAIMTFRKMAQREERAIRLIQGNRTHLGDPHGIAFDQKNNLLFVANYGTSRQALQGTLGAGGSTTTPRIPNWPAGNLMPRFRHEVVLGSGTFGPPSITVYPADAHGNIAPLRVIEGPETQLNWPTGIAFDPQRGDLYVANSIGDAITVFSATAQGNVAPNRILKGSRTLLKNPAGVFVDVANDEVWVANFGNHTASVYKRAASGNTPPLRVIRSAPLNEPTTLISNPFMIAYDTKREEILVPN